MTPQTILASIGFRIFLAIAVLGAGGYAGWKLKAHFAAIEHAQDVAAVASAQKLASDEKLQCVSDIAKANMQAARDLADANARLAAAEDALAHEQGRAHTLNDRLQKALSDESNASKLSTSVLNYLSLLRSYAAEPVDAESAANFGPKTQGASVTP